MLTEVADGGEEVSLEPPIRDDLDSQRSVNSLIVFDPGDILVMEERLDEGCWPNGGKAEIIELECLDLGHCTKNKI